MLGVADGTRRRLIEAAARAFAEHGVQAASLVEITRQAGQRNRGAVHYHFGGRDGLLVAVLEEHAAFLAEREGELLEVARGRPGDVAGVVEAIVRPAVELAETGWRGRDYLAVVGELVEQDQDQLTEDVSAALQQTGGYEVFAVLAERLPAMDDALRDERFALTTAFILGAVARRARASGRPQLPADRFVANLVQMAAGMLAAPTIDA